MRIIDKTPYISETGEIKFADRAKATLKFGANWYPEIQAQQQVLPILKQVLDRNYVLLRNITPPGLGASIPFILVGPPGIVVMYVTHLRGMFRAKGDMWGTIAGNTFKPVNPNLLALTTRMMRAIELYLKRHGYEAITVEGALLCADPGLQVDSQRPIVRVVMGDALDRFAASITQMRAALTPEMVQTISHRLLNPKSADSEDASATASVPAFALPESEAGEAPEPPQYPGFDFTGPAVTEEPPANILDWSKQLAAPARQAARPAAPRRAGSKPGFTTAQWIILAAIGMLLLCVLLVFLYFIFTNLL
ncbi:MAG: hypothetical protein JXB85_11585 [Anaerolineales bacterium]|nr:hypothetical protein [Anaerolineales bacterium]